MMMLGCKMSAYGCEMCRVVKSREKSSIWSCKEVYKAGVQI